MAVSMASFTPRFHRAKGRGRLLLCSTSLRTVLLVSWNRALDNLPKRKCTECLGTRRGAADTGEATRALGVDVTHLPRQVPGKETLI